MTYYFVNSRNEQDGPIEVDQFAAYGITPKTLLWRAGMTKWTRGGDIPELADVFNPAPVPPAPPVEAGPVQKTILSREEVPSQPSEEQYSSEAQPSGSTSADYSGYLNPPADEYQNNPGTYGTHQDGEEPAPSCHLGKAIAGLIMMSFFYTGIFGGFALGIVSIILNVSAYTYWKKGQYEVSQRLERKARDFGIASLILGIVSVVLLIICIVAVMGTTSHCHSSYYYY